MNTTIWAAMATVAAAGATGLVGFLLRRSGGQAGRIQERLRAFDELEPAPPPLSGWTRAFAFMDSTFQMAFGILCLELLGYLAYLYWSGADDAPLARLIRPVYQNLLYLPGMAMIALGGVLGLRK